MKKTSFWVALIAVILIVSVGLVIRQHTAKKDAVIARIYSEGECIRTIDLASVKTTETFEVEGPIGKNTVLVEPGRICITEADCPDHVCVHMGWLSAEHPSPIVCLPNKVVIDLADTSDSPNEIDGVTG